MAVQKQSISHLTNIITSAQAFNGDTLHPLCEPIHSYVLTIIFLLVYSSQYRRQFVTTSNNMFNAKAAANPLTSNPGITSEIVKRNKGYAAQ